jgi:hypothetical protein
MKTIILSFALSIIFLSGCNANTPNNQPEESRQTQKTETTEVKELSVAAEPSIQGIVNAYLKLKNALANDNDRLAASAGKELVNAIDKFDKSALKPEQAKTYADIEEDAREHAEHISTNAGNIKHQREHFATLTEDVYELVKTFGAGQKLYYDHCPMYNKGKGGNWISESKTIQNPYYGKSMSTCGMVKEELK